MSQSLTDGVTVCAEPAAGGAGVPVPHCPGPGQEEAAGAVQQLRGSCCPHRQGQGLRRSPHPGRTEQVGVRDTGCIGLLRSSKLTL